MLMYVTYRNSKNISKYIPKQLLDHLNLSTSKLNSWCETIKLVWISFAGRNMFDAKKAYLSTVKNWPLYGAFIFAVEVSSKCKPTDK